MREGFKEAILNLGQDKNFLVLSGDHGYALFDDFKSAFPNQFFNVGIAEANLVGVAAGLARAGYQPLIYGLASFLPNRVYEFLKLQVALDSLPVTVVGDGGGLVYSTLGHSHQSLDDLAIANALPNFSIFSPSSDGEAAAILQHQNRLTGPRYLRLGKSDGGYKGSFNNVVGEAYLISAGSDKGKAIVCHGAMTSRVLALKDSGQIPDFDVWSYPTLKSPSRNWMEGALGYGKVIIVEEHIEHGGLFSILLPSFADTRVHLVPVCASKEFHHGVGNYEWALESRGLGNADLVAKINQH
jgi:transketolase